MAKISVQFPWNCEFGSKRWLVAAGIVLQVAASVICRKNDTDSDIIVSPVEPTKPGFWTPQRMESATPRQLTIANLSANISHRQEINALPDKKLTQGTAADKTIPVLMTSRRKRGASPDVGTPGADPASAAQESSTAENTIPPSTVAATPPWNAAVVAIEAAGAAVTELPTAPTIDVPADAPVLLVGAPAPVLPGDVPITNGDAATPVLPGGVSAASVLPGSLPVPTGDAAIPVLPGGAPVPLGDAAAPGWPESSQSRALPKLTADALAKLGINRTTANGIHVVRAGQRRGATVVKTDVNQPPFDAMGRLFFTDSSGREYTCSGQYVAQKVVLTASHCVYDPDLMTFNKNYHFVQRYQRGRGSGDKTVKHAVIFQGWYRSGEPAFAYDFALLAMNEPTDDGAFVPVGVPDDVTEWTAAGYPSNYGNGRQLASTHGYRGSLSKDVVEMQDNLLGEGSSGGGWYVKDENGNPLIVGLNSFAVDGENSMFSPRFYARTMNALIQAASKAADEA